MKKCVLILILIACSHWISGQVNFGIPDIKNYSRQVYQAGSQNWGIGQDKNGIMYFGNNDGLLSFDGYRWRLYPLPDKKNVRSLAFCGDSIFVGGQEDIGYFSPSDKGDMEYHSLKLKIPINVRNDFADVWNVIVRNGAIYFRSNRHIFIYQHGKIEAFKSFNWSFLGKVKDDIFAFDDAQGLVRYVSGKWQLMLAKEKFPLNVQISNILNVGDAVWIITLTNGIYKWSGNRLEAFQTPSINHLQKGYIYGAVPISKKRIAFLTNLDGCEILDTLGNILSKISRKEGLQNNNIISGFLDKDKNLWLGLGNGIDMIAINKPIYNIYPDGEDPISGYVSAIYQNNLFLGTATGVYRAPYISSKGIQTNFSLVNASNGQIWNLSNIDNKLLIGQYRNAYEYSGLKKINVNPTGFWNFQKIPNTDIIIAGTYNGVHFFQSTSTGIKDMNMEALFESAQYVAVDGLTIWAMHPYKGLYKVTLSSNFKPKLIGHITNAPFLSASHNHLFKVGDKIIICSDKGIFEWNKAKNTFIISKYFSAIFGKKNLSYIQLNSKGEYWFSENGRLGIARHAEDGQFRLNYFSELDGRLQSNESQHILLVNDSCVIASAERGFIYIDASQYKTIKPHDEVMIRSFMIQTPTKDSLLFGGYKQSGSSSSVLPFKFNSVNFNFCVPIYGYEHAVQYSYRLKGLDENWSSWSEKTEKNYTNLQPGIYHFMVEARNGQGYFKSVDFQFEILAPWYRSIVAYIVYILILLLSIAFVLKYLYNRYDRKQAKKIEVNKAEFKKKQQELEWQHQLEKEQSEKQLAQLNSEKLKMELEMKNTTIAANAMVLIQKGELLNKVRKELSEITEEKEASRLPALKKVIKIVDQEINNKEDWEQFALHFNKVHEDFLKKLKEAHSVLSSGDLKLCALLRLGMSSKDIAGILNISLKAVEIGRYRLRKKLKLNTEDNLFDFLSSIA